MKDKKSGKTIYSYVGVNFGDQGEHTLQFQGMDPFGNARFNQTITVIRSGQVASLRLKSAEGNIADGKTPVKLQIELLDANGTPIPAATDLEIQNGTLKPMKKEGEMPEPKVGMTEQVHVDEKVGRYIVEISHATRGHQDLVLGGSPRASIALFRCAQAFAAIQGFDFVTPDDVKQIAPHVLGHRLILRPESRLRKKTVGAAIEEILNTVPVPPMPAVDNAE